MIKSLVVFLFTLSGIGLFADPTITFSNETGGNIYVYDAAAGSPCKNHTIPPSTSIPITCSGVNKRIYISEDRLTFLETNGTPPDPYNDSFGKNTRMNLIEYTVVGGTFSCLDLSYIDWFSYPLKIVIDSTSWGFTTMSSIVNNLNKQKAQSVDWGNLIYYNNGKFIRVFGPDQIFAFGGGGISGLNTFATQFPANATTLSTEKDPQDPNHYTNVELWKGERNNVPFPSNSPYLAWPQISGYYLALSAASLGVQKFQNQSKVGFFSYPVDNMNGQFNNIPATSKIKICIYSIDVPNANGKPGKKDSDIDL